MNKSAILTKTSKPEIWMQISVGLVVLALIVKIIFIITFFLLDESSSTVDAIKTAKERLNVVNRKKAEIFIKVRRLPLLSDQVEYALEFFNNYELKLDIIDKNKKQHFLLSGDLSAILLAINDIKTTALLINFGDVKINGEKMEVELLILGNINGNTK